MPTPPDGSCADVHNVGVPPQSPPSGFPNSYLQLSDLRTTRRRASDTSTYAQDTPANNAYASAVMCLPPLQSPCIDCVVDCDDKDCLLLQAPVKDQCTDQCVVVACNDENACSEICLEETCQVEPCYGGNNCTGVIEDFFRCCTDLHALPSPSCIDPASSNLNWDYPFDDLLKVGGVQQHFSGYSHFPEFDAQLHIFSSTPTFSDASHESTTLDLLSQGVGSSTVPLPPSQIRIPPMSVQPLSQDTSVSSIPQEFPCRWLTCSDSFGSLNELVGHVNITHLRSPPSPPRPAKRPCMDSGIIDTLPLSCRWDDCQIFSDTSALPGPSTGLQPETVLDMLSSHLFHDHLGVSVAPGQMSLTTISTKEDVREHLGKYDNAFSQCYFDHISGKQEQSQFTSSLPREMSGGDVQSMPTPIQTYATPEPSPPPNLTANEAVHDCASATHVCRWKECGTSFDTCAALTEHLTAAHVGGGKSRYDCYWADCARSDEQGFTSKQKILRHLQAHTGHRPFVCSVCRQHFSEAATLQQHMRRHTQEKPFVCDFPGCGKAFAITGALTIHKRTHNGERPFKCVHCGRAFAESSNLSKHLRTHTGDRPYQCTEPDCGKSFARPDQLQRHGNVHAKKKMLAIPSEPVGAQL